MIVMVANGVGEADSLFLRRSTSVGNLPIIAALFG
jgi:hypothetical protein